MGCTASNPIIESGKALVESTKESAGMALTEGSKTMQDVGEKVKEGITSELDHVQQSVKSAMDSTADNIGSMFGKAESPPGQLIRLRDDAAESLRAADEPAEEAVSQAETIPASEAEMGERPPAEAEELQIEDVDEAAEADGASAPAEGAPGGGEQNKE